MTVESRTTEKPARKILHMPFPVNRELVPPPLKGAMTVGRKRIVSAARVKAEEFFKSEAASGKTATAPSSPPKR